MKSAKSKQMKQPKSNFVKGRIGFHAHGNRGKVQAASGSKSELPQELQCLRAYAQKAVDLELAKKMKADAERHHRETRTDGAFKDFESACTAESLLDSELGSLEFDLLELQIVSVETVEDVGIAKDLWAKKPRFQPSPKVYGKHAQVSSLFMTQGLLLFPSD